MVSRDVPEHEQVIVIRDHAIAADRLNLRVDAQQTTHTLVRMIAVLHSRGAYIEQLYWSAPTSTLGATLTVRIHADPSRHAHLRAALGRIVDVTGVERIP